MLISRELKSQQPHAYVRSAGSAKHRYMITTGWYNTNSRHCSLPHASLTQVQSHGDDVLLGKGQKYVYVPGESLIFSSKSSVRDIVLYGPVNATGVLEVTAKGKCIDLDKCSKRSRVVRRQLTTSYGRQWSNLRLFFEQ